MTKFELISVINIIKKWFLELLSQLFFYVFQYFKVIKASPGALHPPFFIFLLLSAPSTCNRTEKV